MSVHSVDSETLDADTLRDNLYSALQDVHTTGSFATGGVANSLPLPGLNVTGVGPIALPLQPTQANALRDASDQAPFGRGSDTVVDTSIRLCRQIDPNNFSLSNPWNQAVQRLAASSSYALGVTNGAVKASLYKLVLYEPGGFFKPHKDTEKEPHMFASLVIQLPAKHEQGALLVRHRAEEKKFDFSLDSDIQFFSAAFFTDCEHELLKVRNGYRLCLIYNIIRVTGSGPLPSLAQHDATLDGIINAADDWESFDAGCAPEKFALLLDHQYTNKNLAFSNLKGSDAARVHALRRSARFDLHLALIEKHVRGVAECNPYGSSRRYGDWSDDEDNANGHHVMEDIIDQNTNVSKWIAEDDTEASFGRLDIDDEEEMLDGECLFGDGEEPDKSEYESYTGNAGPTVEYFYHRAVLVMWPRSFSITMTCATDFAAAVQLVQRRAQNGDSDAKSTLVGVVTNSQKHINTSRSTLPDLLQVACTLKHKASALKVLKIMSLPLSPQEVRYGSRTATAGCASRNHVKSIVRAVHTFGWKEVSGSVVDVVAATQPSSMGLCAGLALTLHQSEQHVEDGVVMSMAVTTLALQQKLDDSAAPALGRLFFSVPVLHKDCERFATHTTGLSGSALAEVIAEVAKTIRAAQLSGGYLKAFEKLVKTYIVIALSYGAERTSPRSHAGEVLAILTEAQPRDEALLKSYALALVRTQCGTLLRSVLNAKILRDPQQPDPLATGSSVSQAVQSRISDLNRPKPPRTNRQSEAYVPRHGTVTNFLRGDELTLTYTGFSDMRHASNFHWKHFNGRYNREEKHSAKATTGGGDRKPWCKITKTDHVWQRMVQKWEEEMKEVRVLLALTGGRQSENKRRRVGEAGTQKAIDLTAE